MPTSFGRPLFVRVARFGAVVTGIIVVAACSARDNAATPHPPTAPEDAPAPSTAPPAETPNVSAAPAPKEQCGNGFDDDRDGFIDEDCTCEPTIVTAQRCFPGEPSVAGVGACKYGQQRCTREGEFGRWTSCVGFGVPSAETCDNAIDDDCDGQVDEDCNTPTPAPTSPTPSASTPPPPPPGPPTPIEVLLASSFDATTSGSVIVARASRSYEATSAVWSAQVHAQCLTADLVPAGSPILLFEAVPSTEFIFSDARVSRSRTTGHSVVASRVGTSGAHPVRLHFLAPDCSFVTTVEVPDAKVSFYDLELDDAGNVYLFSGSSVVGGSEPWLRSYAPNGSLRFSAKLTPPSHGYYAGHLALQRTTGSGIVTLQGHYFDPIYFRRFTASGTWIESALQTFAPSVDASSWYDSHEVGMNDDGAFVLTWMDHVPGVGLGITGTQKVAFYTNTGAPSGSPALLGTFDMGFDNFRNVHTTIQVIGSDFIIPTNVAHANAGQVFDALARFSSTGVLKSSLAQGKVFGEVVRAGSNVYSRAVDLSLVKKNDLTMP